MGNKWQCLSLKWMVAGCFFGCVLALWAQPSPTWTNRENGTGNGADIARKALVDGFGNVYITGSSLTSGNGLDYVTIKYDKSGTKLWTAQYNNGAVNGNDEAFAMALDGSGNVYVTGRSQGSGSGYDCATVKYNTSGVQQWVARYNGPGNGDDEATAIALDSQRNVYVTGKSVGSSSDFDYATIRYNPNTGAVSTDWGNFGSGTGVRRYNSNNGTDQANAIAVDSNGDVIVTGASMGPGSDGLDYLTIKYRGSDGNEAWSTPARYHGGGFDVDQARAIAVDSQQKIYVTGTSGQLIVYAVTIKYEPDGTPSTTWANTGVGTGVR